MLNKNLVLLKQNWPYLRTPKLPLGTDISIPVPPSANRNRIGPASVTDFVPGGIRDMKCILNIAEVYDAINSDSVVMDWGVGCARVSRHLPVVLRSKFRGVDVDFKNCKWCKNNISWGTYESCEPYGTIDTDDSSIDLLYGVSVFTHLSEISQSHWLKEINRVIKGTALLSVHGLYSAATTTWGVVPEMVSAWLFRGYRDAESPNIDISDVTPKDYYRDVAHTPEYIHRVWNEYIHVVDIIPAGISYHHDVVVCRKKQDDTRQE